MKFKVGDKVKVRKDLRNGYYGIANLEDYQNDKVFTIKNGYNDSYSLKEDKKHFSFLGNMLIPAEEEIILKAIKNEQGFYEIKMPKEIKIYSYGGNGDYDYIKCIKKEILDDIEKEYLRAVIKPFRDRVKSIKKREHYDHLWQDIVIDIKDHKGQLYFPEFEPNTMYKGMEQNKEYTLEELGL